MKSHAVVGLVKCLTHDTYIIKCGCPAPSQEDIARFFRRRHIKIEPAKIAL